VIVNTGNSAMRVINLFAIICFCFGLMACSSIDAVHPVNNQLQSNDQAVPPLQKCKPG